MPNDLITLGEARQLVPSRRAGKPVDHSTLTRWIKAGRIRAWRSGWSLMVSRAELLAYVRPRPVRIWQPEGKPRKRTKADRRYVERVLATIPK